MDEDEIGLGRVLEAIHSYEYEAESKDGSKRLVSSVHNLSTLIALEFHFHCK